MKTLESIMKSNVNKDSSFMYTLRECEKCSALEGQRHKKNKEIVTLKITSDGDKEKLLCQSCIKSLKKNINKTKKTIIEKAKEFIESFFGMILLLLSSSSFTVFQLILVTSS